MKTLTALALTALALPSLGSVPRVVVAYRYDAAGRLTNVNYGGAANTTYAYDKNGSLLSRATSIAPLPALAAGYAGLITNAAPAIANTGTIALKMLPTGGFSGKLTLAGRTVTFKGTFAADGTTQAIPLGALTLTLNLDVEGGSGITGTIGDGTFTSQIAMTASRYDKRANPVPGGVLGAYTAVFEPTSTAVGIPQGTGVATASVNDKGAVLVAGSLADSAKFSASAQLTGDASAPLFVRLYKNRGLLAGTVHFRRTINVGDFDAELAWTRPDTGAAPFPNAFATELDAVGSRYTPPAKGRLALDVPATANNVEFETPSITRAATLDARAKITLATPNPETVKLTLSAKTGLLGGSIFDGGQTRKIQGALIEDQNLGAGYYLNAAGSVPFTLTPAQ